jgi:diaminohydroxyphosphoribosylaminopyrimidine deaminase/5-amino-6-(5-phosphoribosylamino)uracil reductase
MADPNPLVNGAGLALLRAHGVDVTLGILEGEARRLNAPFLTAVRYRRPHVTMKIALSTDEKVAGAGGIPIRLTREVADRRIHRDRAEADAIVIGSGTLLRDDPRLTARGAYRGRTLARVILDRRLRTPPDARVFSTLASGPVIIVTTRVHAACAAGRVDALARAGATVESVPEDGGGYPESALTLLAATGATSAILEGGPSVHRAFWDLGLIDRVQIYRTLRTIGPGGVDWWSTCDAVSATLRDVHATALGPDVLIEGDVHRVG